MGRLCLQMRQRCGIGEVWDHLLQLSNGLVLETARDITEEVTHAYPQTLACCTPTWYKFHGNVGHTRVNLAGIECDDFVAYLGAGELQS